MADDFFAANDGLIPLRQQYEKGLLIAWHGLQILQRAGITVQDKVKKEIADAIRMFKYYDGGDRFDTIDQFYKPANP